MSSGWMVVVSLGLACSPELSPLLGSEQPFAVSGGVVACCYCLEVAVSAVVVVADEEVVVPAVVAGGTAVVAVG